LRQEASVEEILRYPVTVQTPAATFPKARAFLNDDHVEVWAMVGAAASIVASATVRQVHRPGPEHGRNFTVETDEGDFIVSRAGGCGCGAHPLRDIDIEALRV
jgi:hypothetical protein